MYAIVEIAGQQYKVEKGQEIFVHNLDVKKGAKQEFDQVLLIDDKGKVKVGTPTVDKAKVSAKLIEHVQDDKVIVFKKKRRKGYQRKNGHRQGYTLLKINNLQATGTKKVKKKDSSKDTETSTPKKKETE